MPQVCFSVPILVKAGRPNYRFGRANALSDRASACAAGITTVRDGIIAGTGSWLIQPPPGQDSFDRHTTRIHGITPEMTGDGPSLEASMFKLAALIGDGPVLAHNIGYDADVLRISFEIAGLPQPGNEFRSMTSRTERRKSAHDELLGQLDILAREAEKIRAAVYDNDASALADQCQYLEDKFRTSSLDLCRRSGTKWCGCRCGWAHGAVSLRRPVLVD